MSTEQREKRVEEDIRNLARLSSFIPSHLKSLHNIMSRRKRANQDNSSSVEFKFGPDAQESIYRDDNSTDICDDRLCSPLMPPTTTHHSHEHEKPSEEKEEEEEELPKFETLKPFAFGSRINEAVVLEGLTLSPYAFFSQLAQPEMLNFEVLSPRAFVSLFNNVNFINSF